MGQPRGSKTTLKVGAVKADVALFKTTDDPNQVNKWDTAGPNGGILHAVQRGKAITEQAPEGDPLGGGAAPVVEDPPPTIAAPAGAVTTVLVEEGSEEEVAPDEVRRGIRREDGSFADLTDALSEIDERAKLEEMEVVAFVDVGQVPRERVLASYFLAGDEPGAPRTLRVLQEAMLKSRRVAAVKWSKSKKQALGVITTHRSGALLLLQLAWSEDWREVPAKALGHRQATVSETEVAAAVELVQAMRDTRDAIDELRDDAREHRAKLRTAAFDESVEFIMPPRVEPEPEADMAEALRRSAEQVREAA